MEKNNYNTAFTATAEKETSATAQVCVSVSTIFRGEMNADWQIRQEIADRAIALAQVDVFNDHDYLRVQRVISLLNTLRKDIEKDVSEVLADRYATDDEAIEELADAAIDLAVIQLENTVDYYAVLDAVHIIAEVRSALIEHRTHAPKR